MGAVAISDIERFAAELANEFSPEKIILFGSYAKGGQRPDSDIDLLVIMPGEKSGARIAAEIIARLKPALPVELIVRTTGQVSERLALNDFFLKEIIATGKELYAASHH